MNLMSLLNELRIPVEVHLHYFIIQTKNSSTRKEKVSSYPVALWLI